MALNIEMTQGKYWKGGQIPFWLYSLFVVLPITGLFGLDHLLLRSPITAFLKALSLIPLFGFWYFYDMAQLGEKDLIEKNGIGIPFYGPIAIGAEIFTNVKGQQVSPPEVARPWVYIGYVLTTLTFIAFPVNKVVVGDYSGALLQFLMGFTPFIFIAIAWGFYDMYRILFDSKNLLEKGPAHILPASLLIGPYSNRSIIGPFPVEADNSLVMRLVNGVIDAILGIVRTAADGVSGVIQTATSAAETTVKAAETTVKATIGTAASVAEASEGATSFLTKLPKIAADVTESYKVPDELFAAAARQQAARFAQSGGSNSMPSSVSTLIVFSVALLAFGGYTMYTLRTITRPSSDDNDTPPKPATVRGPSKAYR